MTNYIFTEEAREQINEIRNYTRNKWGKQQTKIYLTKLQTILIQLAATPLIGTQRFSDLQQGMYSFPYASHTLYYRIEKDHIVVMAILHQSMTPTIHLNRQHKI